MYTQNKSLMGVEHTHNQNLTDGTQNVFKGVVKKLKKHFMAQVGGMQVSSTVRPKKEVTDTSLDTQTVDAGGTGQDPDPECHGS